jgi:hypothetical protein
MNQPSIIVRVAGTPVFAIPLTLAGMGLIFMWTQGRASVWLALLGCLIAVRTISSFRQRRRYKSWRKQWDSIGNLGKAPGRPMDRKRFATLLAVVLFIGIFAFGPQAAGESTELQNVLTFIWFLCGIFLFGKLVLGIGRLVMKRRKGSTGTPKSENEVMPVSLMLSSTVDAPSREMAVRSLPEYAARILNR